jgi:hypothetical protein
VAQVERAWARVDAGKEHHQIVVIDRGGRRLLSRRVALSMTSPKWAWRSTRRWIRPAT